MTAARLPWLLALLAALAILRIVVPPSQGHAVNLAQAVPRQGRIEPPPAAQRAAEPVVRAAVARLEAASDRPGNAFAVRAPKPPPVAPAAPVLKAPVAVIAPAPAPPEVIVTSAPPPPPFQVIGTWDDGGASGVFVTGPQGTLLARQGSVLMAEYNVVRITAREVWLQHLPTRRELQLPIPYVSPAAPRP
jgi:hypothetical protein